MANNDIRIKLTGTLNQDASVKEINAALSTISTKINEIKLDIKINDKTLTTLNNFTEQMKRLSNEALQTSKHIEEVINPDGSKIKRTWTGDMAGEFKQTETAAKGAKKEIEQTTNALDKYQRRVQNFQNSMRLDMKNLERTHGGFINNASMREFDSQLSKLNPKSKTLNQDMAELRTQFKGVSVEAKSAAGALAQSGIGFGEMMKQAMTKFPIWMLSATLFYAPIRSGMEFGRIIVDIDTKMTDLMKVMNEGTDFEAVFNRATESAENFGQSISNAMDAYIEFAKQGYKDTELGLLSDAGLVAGNVGDITAQKASEYMTASLIQWKKDATDAMGVIDSWNAISNNYATTVEKLAQGQARAGATARAMGLDFDQTNSIIGAVTAATKQSGNEVGNFLKNVLPRLTGRPAQAALDSLDISLTDKEGNLRDIIEVYTEVANKVKNITDAERISVTEGLAGKFHISRMQALLDDLGSADSMFRQMYETSVNSAGSAAEENDRYMQSLQARINLARVEVEKLALAMGEAFISESMIQGMQIFNSLMSMTTEVVKTVGGLPIIFGLLSTILFTVSGRARTFAVAMTQGTTSMTAARAASVGLTANLTAQAAATKAASSAFRAFLGSTGIGLALVGVGFAVEALLGSMEKTRKMSEDLANANERMNSSYKENKEQINGLLDEYKLLQEFEMSGSLDVTGRERYVAVQNELANLLPDLVQGEDSYGNKLLKSSGLIDAKIKLVERQVEAEERLLAIQKESEDADLIAEAEERAKGDLAIAERKLKEFSDKANSMFTGSAIDFDVETIGEATRALEHFYDVREQKLAEGSTMDSPHVKEITDTIEDLEGLLGQYELYTASSQKYDSILVDSRVAATEKIIGENKKLSDSQKLLASDLMATMIGNSPTSGTADFISQMFDAKSLDEAQSAMRKLEDSVAYLKDSTVDNFDQQASVVEGFAQKLKEDLLTGMDETSQEYQNASDSIDDYVYNLIYAEQRILNYAQANGVSVEEARLALIANGELEDSLEDVGDEALSASDKIDLLSQRFSNLTGEAQLTTEEINELIYMYEMLSAQTNRTADEQALLEEVTSSLASVYPTLVNNGVARIDNMRDELRAQEQLAKIVLAAKDGQLDAEETATLANLVNTNSRIKNINSEIMALQKLVDAYAGADGKNYERVKKAAEAGDASAGLALMRMSVPIGKIQMLTAELASATATRGASLNKLSHYYDDSSSSIGKNTGSTKANDKASKDKNSTTKESIYVTDKFKQALESVNAQLERQRKITASFPKHSKTYRDSVQKEIKLLQQKNKLLVDQAKSLENQIKTGKIRQTGTITQTVPTSSSTTSSLSGWSGRQTSNYGWRKDPITGASRWHAGVDLAGAKGTRLDANVDGRVSFAGNKGNGFGNYVEIVDSAGLKHIYAHLDSVAVKIGQQVTKGLKIGAIGSTGRSTGSHLHYEVRKNNKDINPMDYLNSAKAGFKTTSTGSKTVTSTIDQSKQAIDEAKSVLIGLQLDALETAAAIKEMENEIVRSFLAGYEHRRNQYEDYINHEKAISELYERNSKKYLESLSAQRKHMDVQMKSYQAEMNYLQAQLKSGKLNAILQEELRERYEKVRIEVIALKKEIADVKMEYWNSRFSVFDRDIDDIQFLIDLSKQYSSLLVEGSAEYVKELNKQNQYIKEQQKLLLEKRRLIEASLKDTGLTVEQHEALKEQLEEVVLEYWNLENVISETNKNVADNIIDLMKQVYEKQKEAALKVIDEERKAYQKLINDKIKMLDDQYAEEDYLAEKKKKQDEMRALQERINLLALDDSNYAKAQRKKLMDELGVLEEDYLKFVTQKEREERKQSLEEQLQDKEEELDERAEREEQFYEDLINDERAWAEIRKDIMDGVVDEHIAKFQEMTNWLSANLDTIGNSIGTNLIDNLVEAIALMDQVVKTNPTSPDAGKYEDDQDVNETPTASTEPSKPGATPPKTPAKKPSTGSNPNAVNKKGSITRTLKMGSRGEDVKVLQRALGITADGIYGSQTKAAVEKFQRKYGMQVDGIAGMHTLTRLSVWGGSTSGMRRVKSNMPLKASASSSSTSLLNSIPQGSVVDYISKTGNWAKVKFNGKTGFVDANKLIKFDSGGYTGNLPAKGGLAVLHEKELVLNKGETKDFLSAIQILREIQIPDIGKFTRLNTNNNGVQSLVFDNLINIENFSGTDSEVDSVATKMINKLANLGVTIKK